MMILYGIIYSIALVLSVPILFLRGKLHRGFIQRLGWIDQEQRYRLSQKPNLWFHAVSVGEVIAILGLVDQLRREKSDLNIVVTTVTQTGHQLAQKRFHKDVIILYAPLDLAWSVQAFARAIRPVIFIAAETEFWPGLLSYLVKIDTPLVLVNGRISTRSFVNYRRFNFLFRGLLRRFRLCVMQSPLDADRMIALGAPPRAVVVEGSMKFDDEISGKEMTLGEIGFPEHALVWVAGSTHPGEEKIILELFKHFRPQFPDLRLVLAPRHIDRADELCALLKAEGLQYQKFSLGTAANVSPDVVLVDTIGQLRSLYSLASFVFVGKSLVGHGGQNIIEPAFYGKPVIVGPFMENFAMITDLFLAERALIQVQDPGELKDAVHQLLVSPEARSSLGARARNTVNRHRGVTRRTFDRIDRLLRESHFFRPQ